MTEIREPIRSYQRIFRPERRIYQVEGRALPVPGGVPLRWLAYAVGALVTIIVVGSRSPTIAVLAALAAAGAGFVVGGKASAVAAGASAFGLVWIGGFALNLLDWPLRLVVLPVAVATLATQATPDGRRADRFAMSWIALRLAPRRQSLGRGLPPTGVGQVRGGSLWVAPDHHGPELRRGRITGAGVVAFADDVTVRRAGLRQRRLVARPLRSDRVRRRALVTDRLAIGEGEVLEFRAR